MEQQSEEERKKVETQNKNIIYEQFSSIINIYYKTKTFFMTSFGAFASHSASLWCWRLWTEEAEMKANKT